MKICVLCSFGKNALLFLSLCVSSTLLFGFQPLENQSEKPRPFPRGLEIVSINPACEYVRLEYKPQSGGALGPWASSTVVAINVMSPLPEFGAVVEAVSLIGPEGRLPQERIWVRTEATGGDYAPLTAPVPLLKSDFRRPVVESQLEIEVRPRWEDPPGEYQGAIALKPLGPGQQQPEEKSTTRTTSSRKVDFLGEARQISFSLAIPEIIDIAISGGELSFEGLGPEGTYHANQEVRFRVLTNARSWRVVCKAANLKSEKGEIPAERIKWERVDETGRMLEQGNLGLETTILHNRSVRVSPEEEIVLRFSLDVSMADVAGNYKGSISLQGITGD